MELCDPQDPVLQQPPALLVQCMRVGLGIPTKSACSNEGQTKATGQQAQVDYLLTITGPSFSLHFTGSLPYNAPAVKRH